MADTEREAHYLAKLTDKDFRRLGDFIQSNIGIKMPDAKKTMVEGRLRKRLKDLDLISFTEYCDYLFSQTGMKKELPKFIDAVTTNKTDFFREPAHFEFMMNKALPELIKKHGSGTKRRMNIWSSASSTGNEAYTICMVLSEYIERIKNPNFSYSVLATDISDEVLKEAKLAIYHHESASPIPIPLRQKYLMRSKDKKKDLVRIVPALRKKVVFRKLNLLEPDFKIIDMMDIIFCRNVLIYFEKDTQEYLIKRLCKQLLPGGFLFMGHSEVIRCDNLPLKQCASSIYKKND